MELSLNLADLPVGILLIFIGLFFLLSLNDGFIDFVRGITARSIPYVKPISTRVIFAVLGVGFIVSGFIYMFGGKGGGPTACIYSLTAQTDAEAITWLIEQEAAAVVSKDMNLIKDIFTEDATIVDRAAYGGSPQTYYGSTNRYQGLFKDYDFSSATNTTIKATSPINGDTVVYISGSRGDYTGKQTEHYNHPLGSSRWTVKKIDGCWKITMFEFNVPN
jgi:hypothetical protein